MGKVFVPQEPSRYDRNTKLWMPTVNISAAEKYGEIVVMLPPSVNRMHTAPLVSVIRDRMRDFTPDDWVVALGDPSMIAVACCIAQRHTGGLLRMLKWDRVSRDYIAVEINL
jgi:hypothetical protein